jgi:anti-sigma regulatory factor (Ser/Thr protein kinase)
MIVEILAYPNELKTLRAGIKKQLETISTNLDIDLIILAIDEAAQNIIRYAYEMKKSGPIQVEIVEGSNLTVKIRDYGKQIDLSLIKPRDIDDVKVGGLGTHFINTICKNVKYEHATDGNGGTLLTLDF